MSETVFILGAGTSKGAGAPLMADFLDKADELRKQGNVDGFGPDFDRVFNAISELQIVQSKARLDLDNIESVFAAFEIGRLVNKIPGVSSDEIKPLLVSTRRLIFKTLEKTTTYLFYGGRVWPPGPVGLYPKFAGLIRNLSNDRRQNRCSIITFNYDLVLDHALNFYGCRADYCLSKVPKSAYIPLMKLHGSLNWARCSKCGDIIPWTVRAFLKKYYFASSQEKSAVHLDLASRLSSSGLKHCGKDVEPDPVIVPPTWNKTEYQQGLSKVWIRAASELSDAENIFVIGYSLTESDLFFRYLFALGSAGKTRIRRFWVFDPDEKDIVQSRFKKLIGLDTEPRFRFHKLPFIEAIRAIGKELLSKKDYETLRGEMYK